MSNIKTDQMRMVEDSGAAFDIADYPACKLFIPERESSGLALQELVGAQALTFESVGASGDTFSFGNHGVTTVAGVFGMQENGGGTFPDLGSTKDFLCFISVDWGSGDDRSIIFGGGASARFLFNKKASGNTTSVQDDATTSTALSHVFTTTEQCTAMYSDLNNALGGGSNKVYLSVQDGNTQATRGSATTLAGTTGMDMDAAANPMLLGIDTTFYGAAFFSFTSIPDDVEAAMLWMNREWRRGNKVLYPEWKGLS